eukprot:COSAG06_NODE_377_length_16646_cov_21.984589_4_plen_175_part_00
MRKRRKWGGRRVRCKQAASHRTTRRHLRTPRKTNQRRPGDSRHSALVGQRPGPRTAAGIQSGLVGFGLVSAGRTSTSHRGPGWTLGMRRRRGSAWWVFYSPFHWAGLGHNDTRGGTRLAVSSGVAAQRCEIARRSSESRGSASTTGEMPAHQRVASRTSVPHCVPSPRVGGTGK